MKLRHKINHGWAPDRTSNTWADRVEHEAERTTAAAERAYVKAQERLTKAEARARREESRRRPDRKRLARLWGAVEARRQELLTLQRHAESSPAGSQNRGKTAYRGIPRGGVL